MTVQDIDSSIQGMTYSILSRKRELNTEHRIMKRHRLRAEIALLHEIIKDMNVFRGIMQSSMGNDKGRTRPYQDT